jgi:pyroglutamyl-peptidase
VTRVLLTGFEPFADAPVNPSWDAVQMVGETWRGEAEVVVARLPVEFGRAAAEMLALVEAHAPDIVIAVGVAEGRTGLTVERIAVNLHDAPIPDNAGNQPVDEPVVPGADAALWSTLPVKQIVAAIRAGGLPASVSLTAGSFVCNHVFYALQHALRGSDAASGFIHVPASPEMNLSPEVNLGAAALTMTVPTMTVGDIAAALTTALEVSVARHSPHHSAR